MSFLSIQESSLYALLSQSVGVEHTDFLVARLVIPSALIAPVEQPLTRAMLAQALGMVLCGLNWLAVPEAKLYIEEQFTQGRKMFCDHGALRTVACPFTGQLPKGYLAFHRLLSPLGYEMVATYPLPRLRMTGRAYCHQDFPEQILQYFVSELHADQFSQPFQQAVARIMDTSKEPLSKEDDRLLEKLTAYRALALDEARVLLASLVRCFEVQHELPRWSDYTLILEESAEMAWISTEGNRFNHATDRVENVHRVAEEQRLLGRSIKEQVEVSADGRVKQTAFRAAKVLRQFKDERGAQIEQMVPGSFFEFITRDYFPENEKGERKLALHFDTSNAQAIFKMTESTLADIKKG
jgi:Domain of unknown function (DUF1338)